VPDIVFVSPALLQVVPVAIVALRTAPLSSLPQLAIPPVSVAQMTTREAIRNGGCRVEQEFLELNMFSL
jgi:hypothetical protein